MPLPGPRGLYHPSFEHDACGTGFVADLCRQPSHRIVELGLEVLARMSHRGACGADPLTGDGAGILLQIPHVFYERAMARKGKELPNAGDYGVAQAFLSQDPDRRAVADAHPRGRRPLPQPEGHRLARRAGRADGSSGRSGARASRSSASCSSRGCATAAVFERTLFMIRKRAGRLAARQAPATSTSRAARRGRSSTRGSRSPSGSAASTRISTRTTSARRSPSSTRASAPTPSRPGSARTRTATWRTTARSTRCAATRPGWRRASRCWRATRSPSTSPTSSPSSARTAATRRRSTTWSTSSSPAAARSRT